MNRKLKMNRIKVCLVIVLNILIFNAVGQSKTEAFSETKKIAETKFYFEFGEKKYLFFDNVIVFQRKNHFKIGSINCFPILFFPSSITHLKKNLKSNNSSFRSKTLYNIVGFYNDTIFNCIRNKDNRDSFKIQPIFVLNENYKDTTYIDGTFFMWDSYALFSKKIYYSRIDEEMYCYTIFPANKKDDESFEYYVNCDDYINLTEIYISKKRGVIGFATKYGIYYFY